MDSSSFDKNGMIRISKINVRQLLAALVIDSKGENQLNIITTLGDTEPDWLDMDDLEFLVSVVESQQECKCIMRMVSSYIPNPKNMTIGNQAISIIEAYRNGQAFPNGLTICQLYEKEKVIEVKNWWAEYKKSDE
ncbi:MAG: hypothetical protein AAFU57_00005 [Bacteroidota bacterium]